MLGVITFTANEILSHSITRKKMRMNCCFCKNKQQIYEENKNKKYEIKKKFITLKRGNPRRDIKQYFSFSQKYFLQHNSVKWNFNIHLSVFNENTMHTECTFYEQIFSLVCARYNKKIEYIETYTIWTWKKVNGISLYLHSNIIHFHSVIFLSIFPFSKILAFFPLVSHFDWIQFRIFIFFFLHLRCLLCLYHRKSIEFFWKFIRKRMTETLFLYKYIF